jgi:hypothetical protein
MAVTRPPLDLKQRGTGRRGEVEISGTITITAAGAVASVSCEYAPNITGTLGTNRGIILKNAAAGRYDLSFLRKFKNVRPGSVNLIKAGGGAFGNTNANAVNWRVATTNADATIQAYLASSGADTDIASGDIITFSLAVQVT